MSLNICGREYFPGMYSSKRLTGLQLTENYFRELEQKLLERKKAAQLPEVYPCISISRKIGVGALEVADILGRTFKFSIVDREILDHIADDAQLTEKTVAYYDERYPGRVNEFLFFLFGEKSFIKSDYSRHLFSSVLSIAGLESTVFVGRATHLVLPKNRTLAVELICSDKYRVGRLAETCGLSEQDTKKKLAEIDAEQADFIKRTFGKKERTSYDFDLIINLDGMKTPQAAAKIVELAFREKFC